MGDYLYIAFPAGKQPTVDDVRELDRFAEALCRRFAWGTLVGATVDWL